MTNNIELKVTTSSPIALSSDSGNPYYVGARAYVTQTENGAVITITDKEGTTTATLLNGEDGYTPVKGVDYFDGEKGDTGDRGATGATGNGIASAVLNSDYTLTLTFTDGTSYTTSSIRGERGEKGEQGIQGEQGEKGEQGDVNIEQLRALLPTETVSGDMVSITDGQSVVPADSLKVSLSPIQEGSGTPSPTNVRPISGRTEVVTHRTGGQLIDTSTNESGAIDASGNEVANATFNRTDFIPIDKANIYLKTSLSSGYVIRVHGYSASKAWVSQITYVTTDGTDMLVKATVPNGVPYIRVSYPLVGIDNTELWQGTTYTTALGRTVYGGTLDVVSGVLTVDRVIVTFNGASGEQWEYYSVAQGNLFRHTQSDRESGPLINKNVLCNRFDVVDNAVRANGTLSSPNNGGLYFFDFIYNDCSSLAEWRTWLASNNVQVVYPLATPQTYQLTPQQIDLLLGTNHLWSDGELTIVYGADIQRWVEKKLQ